LASFLGCIEKGTLFVLKNAPFSVALFFNGFCQYEKIWENHEKRQLHSQLHSNCIQKMAVSTLPRTTTCSSSMAVFFVNGESFIALSTKQSGNQITLCKQVRFLQTGCIDHPPKSIQPVCFHILESIIEYA